MKRLDEAELAAAAEKATAATREKLGVTRDSAVADGLVLAFMRGVVWYQERVKGALER